MPNPQIIIDRSKRPREEGDVEGNQQVDGTTVHSNPVLAAKSENAAHLKQFDRQGSVGARMRSPKASMIETESLDRANPEWHYRFVNIKNHDKMVQRIEEGYVEAPAPEGRRVRLGDELLLMRIPRAQYEARKADERRLTVSRERAHVDEVESVAEAVVQQLRQRGYAISRKDILINEA